MHPRGDLNVPFIDFPASEGVLYSSLQESKRVGSFFFMHVVPQQAGPLPAQHQLVRWIPHKPEKKTEFLPASAVFSLRQVLNQNMSASTHAGDHFMLNVPARHHNKNECVTQTYFSAVSFIHKGSFHLSPRGYSCNRDFIFPCHSPSLTSFPFHQSHKIPQKNKYTTRMSVFIIKERICKIKGTVHLKYNKIMENQVKIL